MVHYEGIVVVLQVTVVMCTTARVSHRPFRCTIRCLLVYGDQGCDSRTVRVALESFGLIPRFSSVNGSPYCTQGEPQCCGKKFCRPKQAQTNTRMIWKIHALLPSFKYSQSPFQKKLFVFVHTSSTQFFDRAIRVLSS